MPLTDAEIRAQLPSLLRAIAMGDKTTYEHHEPRKRDGKSPEGGTIWLTPRELALTALRAMGEETESLYWPGRPNPAARRHAGNEGRRVRPAPKPQPPRRGHQWHCATFNGRSCDCGIRSPSPATEAKGGRDGR
jgi:hypothetical protein